MPPFRASTRAKERRFAYLPETPEIETDKLDEDIHEELERGSGWLLKAGGAVLFIATRV